MNYGYTARMGGYAGNIGGFKGRKLQRKEIDVESNNIIDDVKKDNIFQIIQIILRIHLKLEAIKKYLFRWKI